MAADLESLLPPVFGVAGLLYLWLAMRVLRESGRAASNTVACFLFLVGSMVLGSAFSFGASDPGVYGVGRVLSFLGGGLIPVALYRVYRDYTVGPPPSLTLVAIAAIPLATILLAVTNPLHQLLWTGTVGIDGVRFSDATDHFWFAKVHAPYAYGLAAYALVALFSRLPDIAVAHRRQIGLFLLAAALPLTVSFANTFLGIGPYRFPFTSLTLTLLLPLYWALGLRMSAGDFSPLAYRTLLDNIHDPIIVLDGEQRIVSANRPAQAILEADESALLGKPLPEDLAEARMLRDYLTGGDLAKTVRLRHDRYYEVYAAPVSGPAGQPQGTMLVCRDVTERRRALHALADSEHLIRSLVENSSSGMLRFAPDQDDSERRFRCTFANRAAERFLSSGDGSLVGMPLAKLELLDPERLYRRFGGAAGAATGVSFETRIEIDEEERWLRVVSEPVGDDFSVTLIDITQRKQAEDKILKDAQRDPLTGLLNRRGFEKEAGAIVGATRSGAVLYLDLNQFKSINDRFGHQAGDALLKAFGHRLEYCLRPEDVLARLGGDEFAVVLPDVNVDDARHVAERLVETAAEAYIIKGQEIRCAASVGIALIPTHGHELWELVSVADQAMYNVKSMGRDAANDRAAYVEAAVAS